MFTDYSDSLYAKRNKKLRMKQFLNLEKTLLNIARKSCPKDTHNMAENAIYSVKIKNGFMIVWDHKFAYYLPYVNEGINPWYPNSEKVKANKGFVDRSIAFMMAYLFQDTGIRKHANRFSEYKDDFKLIKNISENSDVRLGPLFVQQAHDYQKGEMPIIMDKQGEKLMTNLVKSVNKYKVFDNGNTNYMINADIEYNFVNNEVSEIDKDGYYLVDKT